MRKRSKDKLKDKYDSLVKKIEAIETINGIKFEEDYECDIDKLEEYQNRKRITLKRRLVIALGIQKAVRHPLFKQCESITKPNPCLREACKLLMNSLYGKMLEVSLNYSIIPIDQIVMYDDKPHYKSDVGQLVEIEEHQVLSSNGGLVVKIPIENRNTTIHLGIFILAYSKMVMAEYMNIAGRDNIVASETDSIYFPSVLLDQFPDNSKKAKISQAKRELGEEAEEKQILERAEQIEITDVCIEHPNYDPLKPWRIIGEEFGNMEVETDDIGDAMFLGKKCCYFIKSLNKRQKIESSNLSDEEYKEQTRKNTKMTFKGVPNKNLSKQVYETLYSKKYVNVADINVFTRKLFDCEETSVWVGKMTKKISAQMLLKEHTIIQ